MSDSSLLSLAFAEPIVFVDLETTGGSAAEHRITEIGVVEVGRDGVSTWTSLIDPRQPIPAFIQRLTGITDAMVRGAPTFASIAAELFARLDGKLFVAHNANFDRGFLRAEFARAGYTFCPDVLCTVRLSRALFPRESRHGLDALIERHALVPSARHRALADADLVWQFWQRLRNVISPERLDEQIARTTRRYRFAGGVTEDDLEQAPNGHGAYALFGREDVPLYVGRSVRVRNRLRALFVGERRSAKDRRLAEQVRRIEWRAPGGELGAMLAEAEWAAALQPMLNRRLVVPQHAAAGVCWPFDGPVAVVDKTDPVFYHVVDRWRYVGTTASVAQAQVLAAASLGGVDLDPTVYRILQTYWVRGALTIPLVVPAPATESTD